MPARLFFAFFAGCVLTTGCGDGKTDSSAATIPADEMQSGYAEVVGGRLYYETKGSGDAIVLIHGNEGDRRHWDHQFDAFANDLRVLRYDVRGYGKSSLPAEGEPYASHEDLAALLDQLDISRAHIAGWSMGSGFAVDFVLAYPERAMSLVSVGPWVDGYSSPAADSLFADMAVVAEAFAKGGSPAALAAWMHAPFWVATARASSAAEEFARIGADYSWWDFSHSSPRRSLEPKAIERIGDIKAPTLIMTADHDIPACLEIADLLDESVPDSRKVVMGGTGHLLHMEQPEEFNRHVVEFVRSVEVR